MLAAVSHGSGSFLDAAARAEEFLDAHRETLARQGTVVASWRRYRGRRLGPYFRLTLRADGRQRSVYLGADRQLAQRITRELAQLQAQSRQQRVLKRLRRKARRSLRRSLRQLDTELVRVGIRRKGSEFLGVRNRAAPPRAEQGSVQVTRRARSESQDGDRHGQKA